MDVKSYFFRRWNQILELGFLRRRHSRGYTETEFANENFAWSIRPQTIFGPCGRIKFFVPPWHDPFWSPPPPLPLAYVCVWHHPCADNVNTGGFKEFDLARNLYVSGFWGKESDFGINFTIETRKKEKFHFSSYFADSTVPWRANNFLGSLSNALYESLSFFFFWPWLF